MPLVKKRLTMQMMNTIPFFHMKQNNVESSMTCKEMYKTPFLRVVFKN